MALIRLAFGNFLPCSAIPGEATGKAAGPTQMPTAIHSIRGIVTEFEEPRGNYRRSPFRFHKREGVMHLSASHKPNRLPKRFPIGTTYVVEGRGGDEGHLRVFSRYVVLPGGRRINLADDFGGNFAGPASPRTTSSRTSRTELKIGGKAPPAGRKKLCSRAEPPANTAVNRQTPGEAPQPLTLNHPVSNPGRISGRGSSFLRKPAGSGRRAYSRPTTRSSRWIISARPEKPRIASMSAGRAAPDLLRILDVIGA